VASAASAVGLSPLSVIDRALDGLAERGVVFSDAGMFDTTVSYEERGPLAVGPGDPRRWPAVQD
jgi:hypothetical protein